MQQIADALGIKKGSLYYHFSGKEDIVRSLLEGRSTEAQGLAQWAQEHAGMPGLLREVLLRWIDAFSLEKLRGIRFMNANPLLVRTISTDSGVDVSMDLEAIVGLVLPEGASTQQLLLTRMAFMSISTAVAAAADVPNVSDTETIAAARAYAVALAEQIAIAASPHKRESP